MQLSEKKYMKLINKESPLSIEEASFVQEFEDYLLRSKKQAPYLSDENLNIVNHYEKEINFLNSLKERNENQSEAIKRSRRIQGQKSLNVIENERLEKIKNEEIKKELYDKNAGYAMASVILFITLSLGIFIAGVILLLR